MLERIGGGLRFLIPKTERMVRNRAVGRKHLIWRGYVNRAEFEVTARHEGCLADN